MVMKPISTPVFKEGQNYMNVTINEEERDAINAAVVFYIQKHDKNDMSDNTTQRLLKIEEELHDFFKVLSPS